MRVLVLHSRYLSGDTSGENRVVEDEIRLLREAGHEVRSWTPTASVSDALGRMVSAGSAVWSVGAVRRVQDTVRRHRIDVVHAHNLFPALSPAVLRAARRAGAAVVMTLHNYRFQCLPASFLREDEPCELCLGKLPWRGVVYRCYRGSASASSVLATSLVIHRFTHTFEAVDRFLAVSQFLRQKHEEGGMEGGRIIVRANFAPPAPVRQGPGRHFLFIGRLAREKGVDVLLRVWKQLSGGHRLLVVGDGPERGALSSSAPPGVQLVGPLPAHEVSGLVADARAVLVPSRWYEAAVPRVVLEAYAAGVPVLASDIGALPEGVIPERSGKLLPPDQPTAWLAAVEEMTQDAVSEDLGAGAHALWQDHYTPERALETLEAAYGDVIDERQ